ncbi:dynein regulatory complex protein 1 [Cimex lectularius]|uniref:Dynein regulatory complex protein 1 n=1 Tax=Cimex lectularius TaxID=79782 RepID=A0A8I6RRT2_CIMLE|nr:dynein regulatory complex protein 1 [Cimex lectularius]
MEVFGRDDHSVDSEEISNMLVSDDAELRKLARRIRIKKRQQELEPREKTVPPKTEAEKQMEKSMDRIMNLLNTSYLSVTNIRVAAVKSDQERQKVQMEEQEQIRGLIKQEADSAHRKFMEINNKWEEIKHLNDPLDIHNETNLQREKCLQLLEQKDEIIEQLKSNLVESDKVFFSELNKQNEYIDILSDRINSQIYVMNDCFRQELERLEKVITMEKECLLKKRRLHFDHIAKEKENLEMSNLKGKFLMIRDHENEMDEMMVEQEEAMRLTKLELTKKIHKLTLELDNIRNVCMINTEKLTYNYHVLQKREGENRLIKSQQKQVINHLQETVTALRRKSAEESMNAKIKIDRLTKELKYLHNNVKDTYYRAQLFSVSSSKKYFQLWDYNQKVVEELINKLVGADKAFYDFQFCLMWQPPQCSFKRQALPSYIAAKKTLKDMKGNIGISRKLPPMSAEQKNRLLKVIMDSIDERVDFLVEDNIKAFVEPLKNKNKKLVTLDTLFTALNIRELEDIDYVSKFFLPYIKCITCLNEGREIVVKDDEDEDSLGEKVIGNEKEYTYGDGKEVVKHDDITQEKPITDVISEKVRNQFNMANMIVQNEFCSLEGGFDFMNDEGNYTLKMDTMPRGSDIVHRQDVLGMNVKGKTADLPFVLAEKGKKCLQEKNDKNVSSDKISKEVKQQLANLNCREVNHVPGVSPVNVCKALKEFAIKFNEDKGSDNTELLSHMASKKHISLARLLNLDDIEGFWRRYTTIFNRDKIALWNAFLVQIKDYYRILLRRHYLNQEIKATKARNQELRRLLQQYLHPKFKNSNHEELYNKIHKFFEEEPSTIFPPGVDFGILSDKNEEMSILSSNSQTSSVASF